MCQLHMCQLFLMVVLLAPCLGLLSVQITYSATDTNCTGSVVAVTGRSSSTCVARSCSAGIDTVHREVVRCEADTPTLPPGLPVTSPLLVEFGEANCAGNITRFSAAPDSTCVEDLTPNTFTMVSCRGGVLTVSVSCTSNHLAM